MQLREYQLKIVEENLRAMEAGCKATLNGLFTGAGKTVIFCELANRIPGRTLIVCHMRELVQQAAAKVKAVTSLDAAVEMAEQTSSEDGWWSPQIVVASKQTLLSRRGGQPRYKKFAEPFQLVIADEAHILCSPQVVEMFQYFQAGGAMVAGFTATPFRMDGKAMLQGDATLCSSTNSSLAGSTCSGQLPTAGPALR
jgi:superfamily II DNA or RNA helicase